MEVRENLKRGTVEMVMLHLLSGCDMYGYEIMQELKRRSDNKFQLKDGSMYPILYRLIDKKLISDRQVLVGQRRTRVYYSLTEEGKKYLEQIKAEYFFITEGINNILNYKDESQSESSDEKQDNC